MSLWKFSELWNKELQGIPVSPTRRLGHVQSSPHRERLGTPELDIGWVASALVCAASDTAAVDRNEPVRWSFAHGAVDHLAEEVGVSVVASLLLDHVIHHPAQARASIVSPSH
jgi:hypothetical protein